MRLGSLCSGAGGLDMAVEQVFGAKTVWHCETDPAASKALAHRWPGVPNHRDLIATDWSSTEPIDALAFGWPCQPFSSAGKRKGAEDERAIWPHIARAIRVLRPRICVMENVSVVLRSEFQRVADSMAALGYDLRWTCLRASDVGAPHRRERLFVVADSQHGTGHGERARAQSGQGDQGLRHRAAAYTDRGRCEVGTQLDGDATQAAADGDSRERHADRRSGTEVVTGSSVSALLLQTPSVADALGGHLNGSGARRDEPLLPGQVVEMATGWGKYGAAIARWENVTRPAPSPTEPNAKGNPRLNPAFSEWMMGWPAGWVTDVPGISRNDQLRIIGNGVVPQCAAAALTWLLSLEICGVAS